MEQDKFNEAIGAVKKRISSRDENKLQLDLLQRLYERSMRFAEDCDECKNQVLLIERMALHLYHQKDPVDLRRAFQTEYTKMTKHFRERHQLLAPQYYQRKYVNIGSVMGMFLGLLLYLVFPGMGAYGFGLGFFAGMIGGNVYGNRVDQLVAKEGNQL